MTQPAPSPAAKPPPPAHIAIIMDGNGRWATRRGLPRVAGHRAGADAVRRTVTACGDLGVRFLTLYAFSSENWKRPATEVSDLFGLLRLYLRRELAELHANGIRLRVIGERSRLPADVVELIAEGEKVTAGNSRFTLVIAVNYGGQAEIVSAARRIAEAAKAGRLDPENIDEAVFESYLDTTDIPHPDLLVRTSGEQRLSNFLLWQTAYTELIFTPTLWPDFGREALEEAIDEFHRRDRRYGAVGA